MPARSQGAVNRSSATSACPIGSRDEVEHLEGQHELEGCLGIRRVDAERFANPVHPVVHRVGVHGQRLRGRGDVLTGIEVRAQRVEVRRAVLFIVIPHGEQLRFAIVTQLEGAQPRESEQVVFLAAVAQHHRSRLRILRLGGKRASRHAWRCSSARRRRACPP